MRDYKLKFQALWMSLDFKPKPVKKHIESGNRLKAKREIREEVRHSHHCGNGPAAIKNVKV